MRLGSPKQQQSPHPWWHHLPAERRRRREHIALVLRRWRAWLAQRRQLIGLALGFYVILCALPLIAGLPGLTLVAILPLIMVPPVGFLVYWLVWHEFHR